MRVSLGAAAAAAFRRTNRCPAILAAPSRVTCQQPTHEAARQTADAINSTFQSICRYASHMPAWLLQHAKFTRDQIILQYQPKQLTNAGQIVLQRGMATCTCTNECACHIMQQLLWLLLSCLLIAAVNFVAADVMLIDCRCKRAGSRQLHIHS